MKDRNLKIIGLVGLFVFLLTEFVVFWNNDFFAATLEKYHRNKEYKMMHEPLVDVSSLPQVKPSECRYRIIRHSGGVNLALILTPWNRGRNPMPQAVG